MAVYFPKMKYRQAFFTALLSYYGSLKRDIEILAIKMRKKVHLVCTAPPVFLTPLSYLKEGGSESYLCRCLKTDFIFSVNGTPSEVRRLPPGVSGSLT